MIELFEVRSRGLFPVPMACPACASPFTGPGSSLRLWTYFEVGHDVVLTDESRTPERLREARHGTAELAPSPGQASLGASAVIIMPRAPGSVVAMMTLQASQRTSNGNSLSPLVTS